MQTEKRGVTMVRVLDFKTREKLVNHAHSRYGIDKSFFENYLFAISGASVSMICSDKKDKVIQLLRSGLVRSIGIELFSDYRDYTPSSLGFGVFKPCQIKTNFAILDRGLAQAYFNDKEIQVKEVKDKKLLSAGYVACIYCNYVIGTARYDKEREVLVPNLTYVNKKIK